MKANRYGPKLARITAAILGATLAIVFLLALLASPHIRAAPLNEGTGTDPRIQAIIVTASLSISDTRPGDSVNKSVYFNNSVPGVITLTFEISGTPTLTLTAGAAFGEAAQTCTSTMTPWSREVTYSVEAGGRDYPGVAYTVINTDSRQTTAVITYVRDVTAPTVTVTAPAYITETIFEVSWEAIDPSPGSGVSPPYKVEYRQDGGTWQTWHDSIFATSDSFTDAQAGHTYTFRVTAHDQTGNSAAGMATARVGPFRIYLPIILRQWVWWYQYDIYEPNNTPDQAYGPLVSGYPYQDMYIWDATDQDDYYHFIPSGAGNTQVNLSNIPAGSDYDLYIYYYDGQYHQVAYSNNSGNTNESVSFTAAKNTTYFVRVYRYSGFNSQQPYHLTVTYP